MTTKTWSPESLGMPNRQNYRLWNDIELAYNFVETYAPYSISGDLQGFLFVLIRRRWNLASADAYDLPPKMAQARYSTGREDLLSSAPAGLTLESVNKLYLTDRFAENFEHLTAHLVFRGEHETVGKLYGYGTDGFGTYIPLHLLWPDYKEYWGIYISETRVLSLAASLYRYLPEKQMNLFPEGEARRINNLIQIAYQVILRHQLFHFKIEQWALLFELAIGKAYYLPYLKYVYLPTIYDPDDNNLEEALANLSILLSKKIQKLEKDGNLWISRLIEDMFLKPQGPSYRNYQLIRGVPASITDRDRGLHYRKVVNYLCNQIIRHELTPIAPLTPYYLYPPNNNFLRAENLCPIYLIRNLPYQAGVIA